MNVVLEFLAQRKHDIDDNMYYVLRRAFSPKHNKSFLFFLFWITLLCLQGQRAIIWFFQTTKSNRALVHNILWWMGSFINKLINWRITNIKDILACNFFYLLTYTIISFRISKKNLIKLIMQARIVLWYIRATEIRVSWPDQNPHQLIRPNAFKISSKYYIFHVLSSPLYTPS